MLIFIVAVVVYCFCSSEEFDILAFLSFYFVFLLIVISFCFAQLMLCYGDLHDCCSFYFFL